MNHVISAALPGRRRALSWCGRGARLVQALEVEQAFGERVRLGAIQAALDRGWGRPAQAVQVGADIDSMPVVFHMDFGAGLGRKPVESRAPLREILHQPE